MSKRRFFSGMTNKKAQGGWRLGAFKVHVQHFLKEEMLHMAKSDEHLDIQEGAVDGMQNLYFVTSTPRQNATWCFTFRAAGFGSG
jgi:hypothetical protein